MYLFLWISFALVLQAGLYFVDASKSLYGEMQQLDYSYPLCSTSERKLSNGLYIYFINKINTS